MQAGAKLPDTDKDQLKKLNGEESALWSTSSRAKSWPRTKAGALVIDDKAELAGLNQTPDRRRRPVTADARGLKGKWVIPLQNTTQQPLLQSLSDRATREKLFKTSWTRDRTGRCQRHARRPSRAIAKIRAEKAKLLGYADYAA